MGNLSKLFQHQALNTTKLNLAVDINTLNKCSFYSIPLISSFGGREFPISLVLPTDEMHYTEDNTLDLSKYISF